MQQNRYVLGLIRGIEAQFGIVYNYKRVIYDSFTFKPGLTRLIIKTKRFTPINKPFKAMKLQTNPISYHLTTKMNNNHSQIAPGAQPAFYQLPGHINIQAAPLPAHPIYYLGLPVPQFATLTQTNAWLNHPILHSSFGPHPLPDDHPAVPYPAEPGMQWLCYIAPSAGRYIPIDNPAHYINPYDINGPRGFPPHTVPAHLAYPPPIPPPQITYQRPASHLAPASRPHHPPPRDSRFAPPSPVGYLAGGLPGLQNSLLNTGHGLNGPPIANPMANLAVMGYREENNLVAMENQRILRQIDIPDRPEMMDEFCGENRREVERLQPIWEIERAGGASLSNFGSIGANTGGSGGEMGAGEVGDGGDEEDSLSESDMDYEG